MYMCFVNDHKERPGAKTIKKKKKSTRNKSQIQCGKIYEVMSFLSTDCELSTETCSKKVKGSFQNHRSYTCLQKPCLHKSHWSYTLRVATILASVSGAPRMA